MAARKIPFSRLRDEKRKPPKPQASAAKPPAPKPKPPPPPPPPPDPLRAVKEALVAYWGTSGRDRDGTAMRQAVRAARLTKEQRESLLDGLPPVSASDTGARVAECQRVLERVVG